MQSKPEEILMRQGRRNLGISLLLLSSSVCQQGFTPVKHVISSNSSVMCIHSVFFPQAHPPPWKTTFGKCFFGGFWARAVGKDQRRCCPLSLHRQVFHCMNHKWQSSKVLEGNMQVPVPPNLDEHKPAEASLDCALRCGVIN